VKIPWTKYETAMVRKSITAGVTADLPLMVVDLSDGRLSSPEIGGLVAAFLVAALAVFGIKNKPAPPSEE
jgi:hypothetical protein